MRPSKPSQSKHHPFMGHTGNNLRKGTGVKRHILVAVFLVLLAVVVHAKSTKLVASWKNPQYPTPKFHRVLVLGMSANPGVRADFEDALSQLVTRDGVEALDRLRLWWPERSRNRSLESSNRLPVAHSICSWGHIWGQFIVLNE